MKCPECGASFSYVSRTHYGEGNATVRRSRCCPSCGHTWETVERIVTDDAQAWKETIRAEAAQHARAIAAIAAAGG